MKKIIALLLLTAIVAMGIALAGILPTTKEVYGEFMPSAEFAIGRQPDSDTTVSDNRVQEYTSFTNEDYKLFSQYLGSWGCTLGKTASDETQVSSQIKYGNSIITFTYNRKNQVATITYPAGTRPETEKGGGNADKEILPKLSTLFGLPTMAQAIKQFADTTNTYEEYTEEIYLNIGEKEFETFSSYLLSKGCSLKSYTLEDEVFNAQLEYHGEDFSFTYVRKDKKAVCAYPSNSITELSTFATPKPTPSPTPSPTPTPKATAKPTASPTPTPKATSLANKVNGQAAYNLAQKYECTYDYRANSRVVSCSSSWNGTDFSMTYRVEYSRYPYVSYDTKILLSFKKGSTLEEINPTIKIVLDTVPGVDNINLVQITINGKTTTLNKAASSSNRKAGEWWPHYPIHDVDIVFNKDNFSTYRQLMNNGGTIIYSNIYPSSMRIFDFSEYEEQQALKIVWEVFEASGIYDIITGKSTASTSSSTSSSNDKSVGKVKVLAGSYLRSRPSFDSIAIFYTTKDEIYNYRSYSNGWYEIDEFGTGRYGTYVYESRCQKVN